MSLEILFLAQQFQCSYDSPLAKFEVTLKENNIEYVIEQNEKVLIPGINSIDEIDELLVTNVSNGSCMVNNPMRIELDNGDEIPDLPGLYNQTSITDIMNTEVDTEYKGLSLFELGTDNPNSKAADFQDIILIYNSNPVIPAVKILAD